MLYLPGMRNFGKRKDCPSFKLYFQTLKFFNNIILQIYFIHFSYSKSMHYSIRFEPSPPSLCKVCKTSIFTEQRGKNESSKKLNDFQSHLSCKWKTQYQNLQTPQKVFFSSIKAFKNILSSLLYKIEVSQNIFKFS